MKKKTARRLAIILALVILCPEIALANLQNPVSTLIIQDDPTGSSTGDFYTIKLNWDRPMASAKLDQDRTLITPAYGADDRTRAERYTVRTRNATKSENMIHATDTFSDTDEHVSTRLSRVRLDSGSLYIFDILPSHYHWYQMPDQTIIQRDAPIDNTMPKSYAMYLTDIKITSVKGSGKELTVVWDNPTLDGSSIFTGYRIYHSKGGKTAIIDETLYTDIPLSEIETTPSGKLQHTLRDEGLEIGKYYAVKVEPLLNGKLARQLTTLQISNQVYSFAYRPMTTEYRYDDAYIQPALKVEAEGQDFVKITWDSLAASMQDITRVEIFECRSPTMENKTRLGILFDSEAKKINYWLAPRPDTVMYYQIIIYYGKSPEEHMDSEIAWFDPAFTDFAPYRPSILELGIDGLDSPTISATWLAFARKPYSADEKKAVDPLYQNDFIDRAIVYDIYVTDNIKNFDNPRFNDKMIKTLDAAGLQVNPFRPENSSRDLPSYTTNLTEYCHVMEDGSVMRSALSDNKVYYVKIIARRDPGGQKSLPAQDSIFAPPQGKIATNPQMLAKPPLRIKEDEDGVEEITENSIGIQWDMLYYEAYNEADKSWHAELGVNLDGTVSFGKEAQLSQYKYSLNKIGSHTILDIREELRLLGASIWADIPIRQINMEGASFEIHVARHDDVQASGGYETYMLSISKPESVAAWAPITGTGDRLHPDYTVTSDYMGNPLVENTAYAVFFRPYIIQDGKRTSHYPSFVTATTLGKKPPLELTPTVPTLLPGEATDMTLTVLWEFTPELSYELKWSSAIGDYPEGGNVVTWEEIQDSAVYLTKNGLPHIQYTLKGLFPKTVTHIWIRSIANNPSGPAYSAWSNPVTMETLDIIAPKPPKGLGLADDSHVTEYNTLNGTALVPQGLDYIIVEWMLDANDGHTQEDNPKAPSSAEGPQFLGSPSMARMFMVKFGDLLPNRPYYMRAKTILTVTKKDGSIVTSYAYTVSLSANPNFLDAMEITVPSLTPEKDLDPVFAKRKESAWSSTVLLHSSKIDEEYDGTAEAGMYPLPQKDFEVIYDRKENKVTYRFRSDGRGVDGTRDNYVDERLISTLIEEKAYSYSIDMDEQFYLPVKTRVLDIPFTVIEAFRERGIELSLKSGEISATIPPGAIPIPDTFGRGSRVLITLSDTDGPSLKSGESYLAKAQELKVSIITPLKTVQATELQKPAKISFSLGDIERAPTNVNAFHASEDTVGWELAPSEKALPLISFYSRRPSKYAVLGFKPPANAPYPGSLHSDPQAIEAASYLNSLFRIEDLHALIPSSTVTASQLNQLVLALARQKGTIRLNDPISSQDADSLKSAGLYQEKSPVTKEDALRALIGLREILVGPVESYPALSQSIFTDLLDLSQDSQDTFLKAEALGFVFPGTRPLYPMRSNPQGPISMGQVFEILSAIAQDANQI
ncbi:MAG: hypothetical protein LBT59_16405 [Clostridiales bacterium]|nr:hypothetical protein [Clostridiales bacterium]